MLSSRVRAEGRRAREASAHHEQGETLGLQAGGANGISGGLRIGARIASVGLLAFVVFSLLAPTAFGAVTRPYTGVSFGPDGVGGSQAFERLASITVDQASGDIYAYALGEGGKVFKFDSKGKPLAFSGLAGSNAMEVGEGPAGSPSFHQIAVAPPGSPGQTEGDIYVANGGPLEIFAPSGLPLPSFTEGEPNGVAVDPAGELFVGKFASLLSKYVPNSNPPNEWPAESQALVDANFGVANVAADGRGIVYASGSNSIGKFEGVADAEPKLIRSASPLAKIAVDPGSSDLYADFENRVAIYGPESELLGIFGKGQISSSQGVAVDSARNKAYADTGAGKIAVFGPLEVVPDAMTNAASELTPHSARLVGTINPDGVAVEECFFEYGETTAYGEVVECEAPGPTEIGSGSAPVSVHADIAGLTKLGTYHFRLVAGNANGTSEAEDEQFTTTSAARTDPAEPVGPDTATLRGTVFPEGESFTGCMFQYGITGRKRFEGEVPCVPPASAIKPSATSASVRAALTELQKNTTYRYRLVLTGTSGSVVGNILTFSTGGEPLITEVRSSGAEQTSANLEADINPQGSATSYAIEWGPTTSYGNVVPVAAGSPIGSGEATIHVQVHITGLAPGSTYHYRVTAQNPSGSAASPDQILESLNSCGLVESRCFELVSPREAGPVDLPSFHSSQAEYHYLAAKRPGALAYVSEAGTLDAVSGAETLSLSLRGPEGWASTFLSPPNEARNEVAEGSSDSSTYLFLNEELSCGFLVSNQPLTQDAASRATVEAGGANLYRRNPDGTYTDLTPLPALNAETVGGVGAAPFAFEGSSQNCEKVIFATPYQYPGLPSAEPQLPGVFEWDRGTLRPFGYVPASGGEVLKLAEIPSSSESADYEYNAVSADGSRVFFNAERAESANPEEVGRQAVFVREADGVTRDLSLSQTAIPDTGAKFRFATKSGSRVFFTAPTGLTSGIATNGTDLYEYNLEQRALVDLSYAGDAEPAEVSGFIGASEDGSRAYFAAEGRLVPGKGKSRRQNEADETSSLYMTDSGNLSYVGSVASSDLGAVTIGSAQTARVSADGRFLLFESSTQFSGNANERGVRQAYLYDAASGQGTITCISCRQDGHESISPRGNQRLASGLGAHTNSFMVRSLVERNGSPIVFFTQVDALAPFAHDGSNNLYEWSHGQVSLVTAEPATLSTVNVEGFLEEAILQVGASQDGTDLYLATPERLSWEDGDERLSIYDARIGGGFPEPAATPEPCNPTAEGAGACQAGAATPPTSPSAASQGFNGPENPKAKKKQATKKQATKKHHKKKQATKKHHKKKHGKRHADHNRRTGK
jgi:hypothetical protein